MIIATAVDIAIISKQKNSFVFFYFIFLKPKPFDSAAFGD